MGGFAKIVIYFTTAHNNWNDLIRRFSSCSVIGTFKNMVTGYQKYTYSLIKI